MTPNLLDELEKIATGKLDKTAPSVIWLQLDTDGDNAQRDEPWAGRDGVTWCDESIGGLEIQYVRADLYRDMAKRLEALQSLAAAMYQAAGAYDMPARFLDVLSAAGNGKPITEEQVDALLPCETPDTLQRLEAAKRKLSRLTGMRNEWERDAREHLMTFGQHLPASVECLVERFDAAIDATQEGEG